MNHYRITILAAVVSLGLATSALADPGKDGPRRGPGKHGGFGDRPTTAVLEMMTKKLDLTEEQRNKIAPILENAKSQLKEQVGEAKDVFAETKEQIGAVLTDEQKAKFEKGKQAFVGAVGGYVRAHGPEIRERVQGAGKEIALRAALGSLELTEEQRTKLKDLQESVQEKRQAIMEEMKPRFEAIDKHVKDTLESTLTPAQLEQLKEKQADMKEFRKRGPGPGSDS